MGIFWKQFGVSKNGKIQIKLELIDNKKSKINL